MAKLANEKIAQLDERITKIEDTFKGMFRFSYDRTKPRWWNAVKVEIGELSWEESFILVEAIQSLIEHDLTTSLTRISSFASAQKPLDKLKIITNLLGRIELAKSYAYKNYEKENKE